MGEVIDPGFVPTKEERQQAGEAIREAAKYFRRELLRATAGWPLRFLRDRGLGNATVPAASWRVGYAPESYSRLTDYLQKSGFGFATLVRAGLMTWTDEGAPVDRYRDRLMFISRNDQMDPVGFVAINREGRVDSLPPETAMFHPSNGLVGLQEQSDLLDIGATPVIVDSPTDAMAIEELSRSTAKEYVGVALCESPMSTAQMRILARHSQTDRVIVTLSSEKSSRQRTTNAALDLPLFFDRVDALPLPRGDAMSSLAHSPSERLTLQTYLALARPLTGYKHGVNLNGTQHTSLEIEDPGPGLGP
jgi:hypothetical protein